MSPVKTPNILLPNEKINLEKWAVIECDQFVEQPEYWNKLKQHVKGSPSTFNMMIPEAYIKNADRKDYENIFLTMDEYVNQEILRSNNQNAILVERVFEENIRRGIMLLIDLESYSATDRNALIRPSEQVSSHKKNICYKIRSSALLEMPHIIMLIEDEKDIINIYSKMNNEKIYDFELNMQGGHLKGYNILEKEKLIKDFKELCINSCNQNKPFMIVGDGNHSVLSSKEYWDDLKKTLSEDEKLYHPSRYLLVEVENICSEAVKLYPIHRILNNFSQDFYIKLEQMSIFKNQKLRKKENYYYVDLNQNNIDTISIINDIQKLIDEYINKNGSEVNYTYDDSDFLNIIKENSNKKGIMMPTIEKSQIFTYISKHGILPKKTFSLGRGREKRYYLETRIIR